LSRLVVIQSDHGNAAVRIVGVEVVKFAPAVIMNDNDQLIPATGVDLEFPPNPREI